MALRFAANLNFLFIEGSSIAERIKLAHCAGFRAVEIPFPSVPDLGTKDDVINAVKSTGIEVALINISVGSDDLRFGCASIPGEEAEFKHHLAETIDLAIALNCKKIHIMAGLMNKGAEITNALETYKGNLQYAVGQLTKSNVTGVIEPINKYSVPGYFLNSYKTASNLIKDIDSPHLKLLLDIFHRQHIEGNITNAFKELADIIGHIQIAQVPHRHEPDVQGELDFGYIFSLIRNSGYNGWIGCEYSPNSSTTAGLKWLQQYQLKL